MGSWKISSKVTIVRTQDKIDCRGQIQMESHNKKVTQLQNISSEGWAGGGGRQRWTHMANECTATSYCSAEPAWKFMQSAELVYIILF